MFFSQQESPVAKSLRDAVAAYIQQLIINQQISQYDGTTLNNMIAPHIQSIANNINAQYPAGVDWSIVQQTAVNMVASAVSKVQQAQPQPQYQIAAPQMINTNPVTQINAGGFSPQQNRPVQQTQQPVQQTVNVKQSIVKPTTPDRSYSCINDQHYNDFSTKSKSDKPIVDIVSKMQLTDNEGSKFNYVSAICHVPEPSIGHVANAFVKTNRQLCAGNYIIDMSHKRYVLREIAAAACAPIDLSALKDPQIENIPVDVTITKIVDSIFARDFNVVSNLGAILVNHINDLLKRSIRLSDDIDNIMEIETLEDICTLASMRDRKNFRKLNFHRDYESKILGCFIVALNEVITNKTLTGFYHVKEIGKHLLANPNFFIRDKGIFERDMDLEDKTFVDAIAAKYTAFASEGNLVISNFIPDGLEADLGRAKTLMIDRITNPFDHLIGGVWRNAPKTILMRENAEKFLVMKNGMTLDGMPFVYQDSLDISC